MSIFPPAFCTKAAAILEQCTGRELTIATAESCTGGLLSAILTELPGSSAMFTHGFITYANEAKNQLVGVSPELIHAHGAVSEPVARAMADGALRASGASIAIAITGIAGPSGGENKPVGTVHFAIAQQGRATRHEHKIFAGDRSQIRLAATENALDLILAILVRR